MTEYVGFGRFRWLGAGCVVCGEEKRLRSQEDGIV